MAVYFIQDAVGNVKIGRAISVRRRLAALQTAHAQELRLLRFIEGGKHEEQQCHQEFSDLRIRGEWFAFDVRMLSYVPSSDHECQAQRAAPVRREGKEMRLREFCESHTQSEAARLLGRTQGAVSQMLKAGREVVIVDLGDGAFAAYENRVIKPLESAAA